MTVSKTTVSRERALSIITAEIRSMEDGVLEEILSIISNVYRGGAIRLVDIKISAEG